MWRLIDLPADLLAIHLLPLLPLRDLSALSTACSSLRDLGRAEFRLRFLGLGAALAPNAAFALCRTILKCLVRRDPRALAAVLSRAKGHGVTWKELGTFVAKTMSAEHYATCGNALPGTYSRELAVCLADTAAFLVAREASQLPRVAALLRAPFELLASDVSQNYLLAVLRIALEPTLDSIESGDRDKIFGAVLYACGFRGAVQ